MNHVWLNGSILRADEAMLPISDHGLLYGAGFFETFRTFGGKPKNLPAHLLRLRTSCAMLGFSPDLSGVNGAVSQLLTRGVVSDAVFRLTVTSGLPEMPGLSPVYLHPSAILTMRPLPPLLCAGGAVLRVLKTCRSTPEFFPRPKSINYLNNLLAARELALFPESPDEGLFLTHDGFVCEGIVTNFSWLRGNILQLPSRTLGALPGIAQHWLAETWKKNKGTLVESCVTPETLHDADALILSNSVRGPFRVGRLFLADGQALDFPAWPEHLKMLVDSWPHGDE